MPVMAVMMPPAMVMAPAVMAAPTVVAMPAVVVMTAPMDLRRHGLGCLLRGRTRTRIHQRQRLRPVSGCPSRQQSGDGRKTKNRSDIHLHEHSLVVSLNEFQRIMPHPSDVHFHQARRDDVNAP